MKIKLKINVRNRNKNEIKEHNLLNKSRNRKLKKIKRMK